jgi:hypothetical protein
MLALGDDSHPVIFPHLNPPAIVIHSQGRWVDLVFSERLHYHAAHAEQLAAWFAATESRAAKEAKEAAAAAARAQAQAQAQVQARDRCNETAVCPADQSTRCRGSLTENFSCDCCIFQSFILF